MEDLFSSCRRNCKERPTFKAIRGTYKIQFRKKPCTEAYNTDVGNKSLFSQNIPVSKIVLRPILQDKPLIYMPWEI
jgi:hypothetical protein